MIATIWLPFPTVTANNMYTVARGRKILSPQARAYKRELAETLAFLHKRVPRPIEVRTDISIGLDESRKGDCSTREKIIVDALVEAGVLLDDSKEYVRRVSIGWEPGMGGGCIVTLTEAPETFEPIGDAAARVLASLEAKR